MLSSSTQGIIIFVIVCTILILLLITFITVIVYRYQQKQNAYFKNLEELRVKHENAMLQSQVEIQEQTFQNISREIHDNIGQKLTLAKLHLNTLQYTDTSKTRAQITNTVQLIGEAIFDLSDISRSMSSEVILNNGLIKALEWEVAQLDRAGVYTITLAATDNTIFLNTNTELVLFRIAQESLNNIVKHANATTITIQLHYTDTMLTLKIIDNGKGFNSTEKNKYGTGLSNILKRAVALNGHCTIESEPGFGTSIKIEIPLYEDNTTV